VIESLKNSNVVVTGGAGFVGSHIVDRLLAMGARVTIVDNFSTGFSEFANPAAQLVQGDLLDQDLLDRTFAGHDFVFHVAANADVRHGLLHPRVDTTQNLIVTQNVLEAMRANRIQRILFSSTAAVYGDQTVFPTREDCAFPIQTSLYGASKVASEGLLSAYALGYDFRVWIFRMVSLLGPRYSHGHVYDFWKKLRQNPDELEVLGNGLQLKAYLHVLDLVDGMFLAIERGGTAPVNIFNAGHTDCLEVNDSVRIICKELGLTPKIRYSGGDRGWVGDSPRIMVDTSRLRSLGWAPTRGLEAAIVETLRFLVENPFLDRRG
jgi:UDP-glucose 4-epimerase